MKKLMSACLISSALLAACSKKNTEIPTVPDQETLLKQTYGNYLEFSDQNAFENAATQAMLRNPQERSAFEKAQDFQSLNTDYLAFVDELGKMERVRKDTTGLFQLKETYATSVHWEEADVPVSNAPEWKAGFVLNRYGLVKIGGQLMLLTYDKKIALSEPSMEIVKQVLHGQIGEPSASYKITPVIHSKIINVDDPSMARSDPGYNWMEISHGNPAEGQWLITDSDRYRKEIGNKRFDIRMRVASTRRNGVLYGYVSIFLFAQEKWLLNWYQVIAENIKINGTLQLTLNPGIFSGGTVTYNQHYDTHIEDWSYENGYAQEGEQILLISTKLINNPNAPSFTGISNRFQNIWDAPNFASLLFDDVPVFSTTDFQSYGNQYYWMKARSMAGAHPTHSMLTVDATVAGQQFSLNF